jgi:hypothetical protein
LLPASSSSTSACRINVSQRFDDRRGIDRDGASLFVGKDAIENERMNVAIENDPDKFVRLVYNRTATIATGDVRVGDETKIRR